MSSECSSSPGGHCVAIGEADHCVWCDRAAGDGVFSGGDTIGEYIAGECGICGCHDTTIQSDLVTVLRRLYEFDLHRDSCTQARDHEKACGVPGTYYTDWLVGDSLKYRELLLAVLDKAGLVEHGSAIRASWLTERGKKFASLLKGGEA